MKNIFIVDDEEPIRKVLKTHLTKEGYNVIQSIGGSGVFDDLKAASFDLVISDIKMPEVTGVEILEHVKSQYAIVPVIMLTGFNDINLAIDVMKKGAFDYLMKPVKKEDLLSVIQKAFAHAELLIKNKRLQAENDEYRQFLEQKVAARTQALNEKAIELEKAYDTLKSINLRFVNVLAETIEAKDHYTRGHCNRMRDMCVHMGRIIGLPPAEIEAIEYASLLHDLGKIGVREAVLNKEGPLNESENEHMRSHTLVGEKILKGIPNMDEVTSLVVAHHEYFDGTGYPRQLKGDAIPLGARIIAVIDLFDAMHTTRPYRKGLPLEIIFKEMMRVAGTQLDPEIVTLFIDKEVYRVTAS